MGHQLEQDQGWRGRRRLEWKRLEVMGHKVCSKCREVKPASEYYRKGNGLHCYCKPCDHALQAARKKANPERAMLYKARQRAKAGGYPCTITVDDIVIPKFCPIFGLELGELGRGKVYPNTPTLDKKNPALGYIPGNVAVISYEANRLKDCATIEQLRQILNYLENE